MERTKYEKDEYDCFGKKIIYSQRCRACGSLSFSDDMQPGCCYVCGWMECGCEEEDPDEYDQVNRMTLTQARENVKRGYDVDGVIKLRDIDEEKSTS